MSHMPKNHIIVFGHAKHHIPVFFYMRKPGYIIRILSIIVNSDTFRHIHLLFRRIQSFCGIFRTLCNFCIFRILLYSESWHMQNPRYVENSVKAYSGMFTTLCIPYSEFWHIQDLVHLATFRHIPAYLIMIKN